MHFIAFTCREWKPNSLGRYGTNSSASKTCFVTAMFAHMFIRLIIQNRFHLLLKNFSIWNSLSDVLSAPLFVPAVSIHLCCLRRWISSRRSSLQRIFRCQIVPCEDWQFDVLAFAVLFAWEMAWDSPIVNTVLQTMKRQLFMSALNGSLMGIRNRFQSNVASHAGVRGARFSSLPTGEGWKTSSPKNACVGG